QLAAVGQPEIGQLRIELRAAPRTDDLVRSVPATSAVEDLRDVHKVDDPGKERDRFTPGQVEEDLAVPAGVGVLQGRGHSRATAEALGEPGRDLADVCKGACDESPVSTHEARDSLRSRDGAPLAGDPGGGQSQELGAV